MSKSVFLTCIMVSLLILQSCSDNPAGVLQNTENETVSKNSENSSASLTLASTVVMTNLDNPRGLAWGPEGGLYVVEAGNTNISGPCVAVARGENCYSGTGAITRLWKEKQERIASGLPSVYNPGAEDVTGPHHISFQGRGGAYVTIGWGAEPDLRKDLGDSGDQFGVLIKVRPNGNYSVAADLSAFEQNQNPDGGNIDSNPYGLLSEPGKSYVTDAGGNSLIEVCTNGKISLVATFPQTEVPPPFNPPFMVADAVPTMVNRGPDGALYVSTLTGVPFLPGAAGIYKVVPGQAPQLYAGGFTAITDFNWGPDGNLYIVEFASMPFLGGAGALTRIAPDGTRTIISNELTNPTGVLAGPDGAVYVSNRGNVAGNGEVLRFQIEDNL